MKRYVTRIAPSPTGFFHIGTGRTALFNWLAARASGGRFILRMDDTDAERNRPEVEQPIYEGLRWLGLEWDDFFRQSSHVPLCLLAAQSLVDAGRAVRADNGAVLLKWTDDMPRSWTDRIAGEIAITDRDRELIDGLPLVRGGDKAGQPIYNFASVVDDHRVGVNLIIRGTDHIANTAKQVCIWHAINQLHHEGHEHLRSPLPEFAHVGLIFAGGRKMSKRDGAASLLDLRDRSYDPDGVFNFLLRLGWGPREDNKENSILNRERALALFLDGGAMRAAPAGFDAAKLEWFNKRHKAMKEKAA